jgi:hypothetical protein
VLPRNYPANPQVEGGKSKVVKRASELVRTDIAQFVLEDLYSVPLKKEHCWKDRKYDEGRLSLKNFGEYYAANRFTFAPATYTDPNRRIIRIAEVFILHQLGGLLNRSLKGRDYETYRDAIRQALERNIDTAVATMEARWPKETADIVRNNDNCLFG